MISYLFIGCLLPLVQSETGDKFGKTAGNAVYLSPDRTAPFEFYQVNLIIFEF